MSVMKPPCGKPCRECPWRRESIAGWLGPHRSDEWLAMAHGEDQIACHLTIPDDTPEDGSDVHLMTQCSGAAIFRANVFKRTRWATDDEVLPPDREQVFSRNLEFEDHHG